MIGFNGISSPGPSPATSGQETARKLSKPRGSFQQRMPPQPGPPPGGLLLLWSLASWLSGVLGGQFTEEGRIRTV